MRMMKYLGTIIVSFLLVSVANADPRAYAKECYFHPQFNPDNAGNEPFVGGAKQCVVYVDAANVADSLHVAELWYPCTDNGDGTYTGFDVALAEGETFALRSNGELTQCTIQPGNGTEYAADIWRSYLTLKSESGGSCLYKVELRCKNGQQIE